MSNYLNAQQYVNDVNGALDTSVEFPTSFDVTPDGVAITGTSSFTAREVICSLLGGNGLKLPNFQICLKINIANAIADLTGFNVGGFLDGLIAKLNEAEAALDAFMEHTGIDALLDRLNGLIGEIAAIANMINFCGTPVIPRPIPNVIQDAFGAFTGAGKDLLKGLGDIADSDIGGCIGVGGTIGGGPGIGLSFNAGIFQGGALKDLGDVFSDLVNGVTSGFEDRIDSIVNQLDAFSKDIKEMIEFENNYAARTVESSERGGSTFVPPERINTGVGVQVGDLDMTKATNTAAALKYAYDNLSAYRLEDGKTLFDYILEPELLAIISGKDAPQPLVGERTPVLDYCGRETGEYVVTTAQSPVASSAGGTKQVPDQPASNKVTVKTAPPSSPVGSIGDRKGDIAYDDNFMYVCIANYDSTSNIWIKSQLASW